MENMNKNNLDCSLHFKLDDYKLCYTVGEMEGKNGKNLPFRQ